MTDIDAMTDREVELELLIRTEARKLSRFFRTKVPAGDVLELLEATLIAYVDRQDPSSENEHVALFSIAIQQVRAFYAKHGVDPAVHTTTGDIVMFLRGRIYR